MTESIVVNIIWGIVTVFGIVTAGMYGTFRLVVTNKGMFERKPEPRILRTDGWKENA